MFFLKLRQINEELKKKVKSQALEITALSRENDMLRWKLKKISQHIKGFDHIKGNAFSLINQIDSEIKID